MMFKIIRGDLLNIWYLLWPNIITVLDLASTEFSNDDLPISQLSNLPLPKWDYSPGMKLMPETQSKSLGMDNAVTAGAALSACDSLFALLLTHARGGQTIWGMDCQDRRLQCPGKKKLNPFISLQTQSDRRHFLSTLCSRLPLLYRNAAAAKVSAPPLNKYSAQ